MYTVNIKANEHSTRTVPNLDINWGLTQLAIRIAGTMLTNRRNDLHETRSSSVFHQKCGRKWADDCQKHRVPIGLCLPRTCIRNCIYFLYYPMEFVASQNMSRTKVIDFHDCGPIVVDITTTATTAVVPITFQQSLLEIESPG